MHTAETADKFLSQVSTAEKANAALNVLPQNMYGMPSSHSSRSSKRKADTGPDVVDVPAADSSDMTWRQRLSCLDSDQSAARIFARLGRGISGSLTALTQHMLSYQLASSGRCIFLAGGFIRDFIVANLVHEDMDADLYVLDDASGASSVSEYLNEASRFAASLCLQFPEGWEETSDPMLPSCDS